MLPKDKKFHLGSGSDGKHYWLTPSDLMEALQREFQFDCDACPFPRAPDFDGLTCDWGDSTYVNPPFGSVVHHGHKTGPTAWARKALEEHRKGKQVVMVYPLDKWILMLLAAGAEVRNLGDVKWCATEDGSPGNGTGRHVACFILRAVKSAKSVAMGFEGKGEPGMARKKVAAEPVLRDWQQVDEALKTIADFQAAVAIAEGAMNAKIAAIKAEAEPEILTKKQRIARCEKDIQEFTEVHIGELEQQEGRRSKALTWGIVSMRRSTALQTLKGITWSMVVAALKKAKAGKFLRIKEDVNKDAVKAAVGTGDIPPAKLKTFGMQLVDRDTFGYDLVEARIAKPDLAA